MADPTRGISLGSSHPHSLLSSQVGSFTTVALHKCATMHCWDPLCQESPPSGHFSPTRSGRPAWHWRESSSIPLAGGEEGEASTLTPSSHQSRHPCRAEKRKTKPNGRGPSTSEPGPLCSCATVCHSNLSVASERTVETWADRQTWEGWSNEVQNMHQKGKGIMILISSVWFEVVSLSHSYHIRTWRG